MTTTIGVALLGLGNVGGGVVKLLSDHAESIEARLGARLEIRAIAVRDLRKETRLVAFDRTLLTDEVDRALGRDDVSIVSELIGGTTRGRNPGYAAMKRGKQESYE